MHWTRRRFLGTITAAAVAGASRARGQSGPPGERGASGREPFPPSALVAEFLAADGARACPLARLASRATSTSRLVDGVTCFFRGCQDRRGAIIDPYEKKERQYSTPAFALSAAVLGASE